MIIAKEVPVRYECAELIPSLADRVKRSPLAWGMVVTLTAALACTLLVAMLYSHWWGLALYFWYAIPSNTFIHLPHEPAAIYAGTIYAPWLVAAAGSLATVFASSVDYFAIKKVFEFQRFASVKETSLYRVAVRWFRWKPWATIVFFAFTPVPFDPVRVLAPASDYHFGKYVTANVTGRAFLYYLLAAGGAWLPVSSTYLILIGTCIAITPLLGLLWERRRVFIQFSRFYRPFLYRLLNVRVLNGSVDC
jgi:membrane protein YqaA with SNARE-associated domain